MSDTSFGRQSWTQQGAGGKFIGGGGLSQGENLNIIVNVIQGDTSGKAVIEETTVGMGNLGRTSELTAEQQKKNAIAAHENAESIRSTISPVRSISWDLILMGRSLSVLNSVWGGHNETVQKAIGVIYGVGAAIRIVVTIADVARVLVDMQIIKTGTLTALLMGKARAYDAVAAAASRATVAESAEAVAGAVATTAQFIPMGFQKGGVVPYTGLALVHKGETVIPAGGANYSNIIINMNTGPISSDVDVDNLLNKMALRMTVESRRRRQGA